MEIDFTGQGQGSDSGIPANDYLSIPDTYKFSCRVDSGRVYPGCALIWADGLSDLR
jgi:hypothetical protein